MRYLTALTILSLSLVLSGFKAPEYTSSDTRVVAKTAKTGKTENTKKAEKVKKSNKMDRDTSLNDKDKSKQDSGKDVHEDGDLTKKELNIINRNLNSGEYYGFLLSDYDEPKYIDWDEVFYCGAGIDQERLSKAAEKEFLRKTGNDEIYTDLTVLAGDDVEDFVLKTTGLPYSKMRNPLDWTYLKKYDLYVFEHGDTNQVNIEVLSGYVRDGEYIVRYNHNNWWGEYSDCEYEVCFTESDDGYCFISNLPDPETGAKSQYIIPDSDSRYIDDDDLNGMDADTLRLARNEIYARHGRKFKDSSLQSYFDSKSWYSATDDSDSKIENSLNKYEKSNIQFISKYEKKKR